MTWGRDTDVTDATEQMREFLDAGGSLVDTAAHYGDGDAEEVIGQIIGSLGCRDRLVICAKAGIRTDPAPHVDISRGFLLDSLDRTLANLGTDHVDVWAVQHFDPTIRVEETVSALEHAVRTGRARYVGVSNYPAWALAEIACHLQQHGLSLAVHEAEYSLLNRRLEGEVVDATTHFGAGVFAWSPLARGVLTGKYRTHTPPDSRAATEHLGGFVSPYLDPRYAGIVEAVATAADGLGMSAGQVALAWVRDAPGITSALLGARTPGQLTQLLEVADFQLPHQIRKALDDSSAAAAGGSRSTIR